MLSLSNWSSRVKLGGKWKKRKVVINMYTISFEMLSWMRKNSLFVVIFNVTSHAVPPAYLGEIHAYAEPGVIFKTY